MCLPLYVIMYNPSLQEYDSPEVRDVVHGLIVAEMRSFAPADYLAYLPYPELNFKSPILKVRYVCHRH